MKNPLFLAYGILVLGFSTYAQFHAWSIFPPRQGRAAPITPKTVRDNPGVNRPNYGSAPRYSGGK